MESSRWVSHLSSPAGASVLVGRAGQFQRLEASVSIKYINILLYQHCSFQFFFNMSFFMIKNNSISISLVSYMWVVISAFLISWWILACFLFSSGRMLSLLKIIKGMSQERAGKPTLWRKKNQQLLVFRGVNTSAVARFKLPRESAHKILEY